MFPFSSVGGDTTPPTIVDCPNDIIREATAGLGYEQMSWTIPTATDMPGMATLSSAEPFGFEATSGFFRVGELVTLKYTFTDMAGNEATCEFRVGALGTYIFKDDNMSHSLYVGIILYEPKTKDSQDFPLGAKSI